MKGYTQTIPLAIEKRPPKMKLKSTEVINEIVGFVKAAFHLENLLNPEIEFHESKSNTRFLKVWNNGNGTYWIHFETPTIKIKFKTTESKFLN